MRYRMYRKHIRLKDGTTSPEDTKSLKSSKMFLTLRLLQKLWSSTLRTLSSSGFRYDNLPDAYKLRPIIEQQWSVWNVQIKYLEMKNKSKTKVLGSCIFPIGSLDSGIFLNGFFGTWIFLIGSLMTYFARLLELQFMYYYHWDKNIMHLMFLSIHYVIVRLNLQMN